MLRDFVIKLCSLFTVESTTHEVVINILFITTETERRICDRFLKYVIVK